MQQSIFDFCVIIGLQFKMKRRSEVFTRKVIKRDGHIVDYSPDKIEEAVSKANLEVSEEDRVSDIQIRNIIKYIEGLHKKRMLVEDIQDVIEKRLMALGKYELAK